MWVSLHLYCGKDLYGDSIDDLLVDGVAPLLERLRRRKRIMSSFFIRYEDPESHVRLRLAASEGVDGDGLKSDVEEMAEGLDFPVTVRVVPYEPETERYGGVDALPLAEEHFDLSSRTALKLLAETRGEARSRRLGKTLLTSVLLVFCAGRDRHWTKQFLAGYAQRYRHYLDPGSAPQQDLDQRLEALGMAGVAGQTDVQAAASMARALDALLMVAASEESLSVPILEQWRRGALSTLEGLQSLHRDGRLLVPSGLRPDQALQPIVGSFLHMHHNRLGLSIPQEIYATHLAARALEALEEAS